MILKALDLCSGAGGAGMGYARVGFDVTGVDIKRQPRYPFEFVQGDALAFVKEHGHEFDLIHASPPCQRWSWAQRINDNEHPDLIRSLRDAILAIGKPYVIENVEGARSELRDPVTLCGASFGLRTYRHRLFETSFVVTQPPHPDHVAPQNKVGRRPKPHEFMHVVGNFIGAQEGRDAMGIQWMTRDELSESIPPAYTRYIAQEWLSQLDLPAAA